MIRATVNEQNIIKLLRRALPYSKIIIQKNPAQNPSEFQVKIEEGWKFLRKLDKQNRGV